MISGEPEMRAREANLAAGTVPLLPSTLRALQKFGQDEGLSARLA
jgi:hypothetical protein